MPALAGLPRAGIVHRLDKDTSGLLVVAKTPAAQTSLVRQLQARSVKRDYLALVLGVPPASGKVEAPVGRHPVLRTRMAVVATGKPAVTHYRVRCAGAGWSLLECSLETGRTHQIRVHLASIGHPLLGDPAYLGRAATRGSAGGARVPAPGAARRTARAHASGERCAADVGKRTALPISLLCLRRFNSMLLPADWIVPDWPAPARVRSLVTTRNGGTSGPPFDSMNLARASRRRPRCRERKSRAPARAPPGGALLAAAGAWEPRGGGR